MAKAVIFGGTAEGRELAEYAESKGIAALISVVSEYGREILGETKGIRVRCGALEEDGICRLLEEEKPELVVDATHPYAAAATEQIGQACKKAGVRCVRVLRKEGGRENEGKGTEREEGCFWVDTPREAVRLLEMDDQPVLLTTGSKELRVFAEAEHLQNRIYARVLPDSQVLAECQALGIRGKRLIAMQGPFSEEMNRALIHQTGAGWLVTKESGEKGGFWEKIEAAKACRIPVIVIRRPGQTEGMSVQEAKEELAGLAGGCGQQGEGSVVSDHKKERVGREAGQTGEKVKERRSLFLIGMGMGAGKQLTLEALEALSQCDVVMGAARMLQDIEPWTKGKPVEPVYLGKDVLQWLDSHPECRRAGVVYSGDTGFYSGCSSLMKELKMADKTKGEDSQIRDFQVRIFPGISALSCLCARLGRPWEGIYPASVHGRTCDYIGLLKKHGEIFLLLSNGEDLGKICRKLTQEGMGDVRTAAGVRLGYEDEQILTGCAKEFGDIKTADLAAVILKCV